MKNEQHKAAKVFQCIGALLGWFAVIFQLYLMLQNNPESTGETLIRFFGFFTILTNILCAICFTSLLFNNRNFFTKASALNAVTVYIFVVGLVYNGILRFLWAPEGLQRVVDEMLHLIIPVLFIIYWFLFVPKQTATWKNILPGLIYPALYCIFVLIRGHFSAYYPYPFMNVVTLGYNKVLINICGMIVVFLLAFIAVTGIARFITSRSKAIVL